MIHVRGNDERMREMAQKKRKNIGTSLKGEITNCVRVNIRKEPNRECEVITILNYGDTVTVYPEKSIDGWSFIVIPDGREGFCMKEFIDLEE